MIGLVFLMKINRLDALIFNSIIGVILMPSKNRESGTKKTDAKLSKNKKSTLASQAIGTKNRDDRHKMIVTTA